MDSQNKTLAKAHLIFIIYPRAKARGNRIQIDKCFIPKESLRDKLFNLTYEEVEIIDPVIGDIISEKDYEKFEIEK